MSNKKRVELKTLYPIIKEKLNDGGTIELPITGTSMLPLLVWGRDSVTLKKSDSIKTNDVIFYRRDDGHFVLHRVVGEDEHGFILCGDNQWSKEYGITQKHIIGKVIMITRKGRTFSSDNSKYCLYCKIWLVILPIRKFVLYPIHKIRAIKRKIIKEQ